MAEIKIGQLGRIREEKFFWGGKMSIGDEQFFKRNNHSICILSMVEVKIR